MSGTVLQNLYDKQVVRASLPGALSAFSADRSVKVRYLLAAAHLHTIPKPEPRRN